MVCFMQIKSYLDRDIVLHVRVHVCSMYLICNIHFMYANDASDAYRHQL